MPLEECGSASCRGSLRTGRCPLRRAALRRCLSSACWRTAGVRRSPGRSRCWRRVSSGSPAGAVRSRRRRTSSCPRSASATGTRYSRCAGPWACTRCRRTAVCRRTWERGGRTPGGRRGCCRRDVSPSWSSVASTCWPVAARSAPGRGCRPRTWSCAGAAPRRRSFRRTRSSAGVAAGWGRWGAARGCPGSSRCTWRRTCAAVNTLTCVSSQTESKINIVWRIRITQNNCISC